jgi:hypothetical protein
MLDFEKPVEEVERKPDEAAEEPETEETAAETQETKEPEGVLNRDRETVPLSALIKAREETKAERQKRLELEREIAATRAEREKAEEVKRLVDELGYTEAVAKREVEARFDERRKLADIERRLMLREIRDLARDGTLYAGADKYEDEICDAMKKYGVDAKKAYFLVCDPDIVEAALHDKQTEREQVNLVKRAETEAKRVETAAPTPVKAGPRLSPADLRALKRLQEAQPDAGWTAEKYAEMMKGTLVPKE